MELFLMNVEFQLALRIEQRGHVIGGIVHQGEQLPDAAAGSMNLQVERIDVLQQMRAAEDVFGTGAHAADHEQSLTDFIG